MPSAEILSLNRAVGEHPGRAITKGEHPGITKGSQPTDLTALQAKVAANGVFHQQQFRQHNPHIMYPFTQNYRPSYPLLPLSDINSLYQSCDSLQQRPQLSPTSYSYFNGPSPFQPNNPANQQTYTETDTVASSLNSLQLQSQPGTGLQSQPGTCFQPWSDHVHTEIEENFSDSDEEEGIQTHPNKFPVEIEYHNNKHCSYQRQKTRSGEKFKKKMISKNNPQTLQPEVELQQVKFYQKHLVRICRCGEYTQMDGALQHGRNNDCNGYEIHYSQKCRWKAYDDFRTGKRVLIRLCKCYKPQI